MEGKATVCTPHMGYRLAPGGTYDCHGYPLKGCGGGVNLNGWAPIGMHGSPIGTQNRKETP